METTVLTPKGFKLIGDIKVGDAVCNPDGTTAKVIKVVDNGQKQFYRVTLADGSSVEADEDHLWAISISGVRRRRKENVPVIPSGLRPEDEWNLRVQSRCRIVNTVELRELVQRADADKASGTTPRYVQIPLTSPVALTGAKGRWDVLSPYILGALVGDGSIGSGSANISGIDPPIFDRIRAELPDHLKLSENAFDGRCPSYLIARRHAVTDDASAAAFLAELNRLLSARGWRQADLVAAGVGTQAYLSAVMNGKKRPAGKFVARLDDALGAEGTLNAAHADHAGASAMDLLQRDGLAGKRSWEKFIPERIKVAPIEDRFAFAQGLMDTDGHMDERGHVEFVSVSEQLTRDLRDLLHSLGYRATLTTKTPTFMHKGEKKEGRLAYRLYIQGRHLDRLFHMPRKRERVARFNGGDVEPWHRVVSVEPTEIDNSRCIQVDNLNHLYVTDDYIVTHNTKALVMEGIRQCIRHPGLRVGAFRRTYGELKESLLAELAQVSYAGAVGATWNGTEYELRFGNGSLLMFRYAESIKDATRRQGGQYQLLLFDERNLTPPDVVAFLESRLRSGRSDIPVVGIRSGTNPGGPGHGTSKARYVDATDYGEKVVVDERGRTVRFIPSKLTDNPHVNPEYAQDLKALPEQMRKAFLDGSWDAFMGQMFTEFSWDRHVVDPTSLPSSWKRYNGIDWGYTAPWSVLWGAVDEDGRLWVYRELYERQVGEAEQARKILAAERDGEHVAARFADDAMWATRGDAKPISTVYSENGVSLTPAGKGGRVPGWQRVHSLLAEAPACPHHRELGWTTCPMIHISRMCRELLRELPALPHATSGDPEDADTTASDHAMDALRYMAINLGAGPEFIMLDSPAEPLPVEVLKPLGPSMAVRPKDDSHQRNWWDDDESPTAGRTAVSPFA